MSLRARMTRRSILACTAQGSLILLGLSAGGCSGGDGLVPIKIGRDVCEHCRMIIGDGRFAAEAVSASRPRTAMFDDIGCAVAWASGAGLVDDLGTRLFAADMDRSLRDEAPTHWLDARNCGYRADQLTPMGYGFGATSLPIGGQVLSFAEVRKSVLSKLNCLPSQTQPSDALPSGGERL